MNKKLLGDLVQSPKEAGEIKWGEIEPSRRFKVECLDVKLVRKRAGLSQGAMRLNIQKWGSSAGVIETGSNPHIETSSSA